MIIFLLYSLFWIHDNFSWQALRKLNSGKRLAENAFLEKDYEKAADLYFQLTYLPILPDPENRFNLALSYVNAGNPAAAAEHFRLLTSVPDKKLASRVYVQLARIDIHNKDTTRALRHLIQAMELDPQSATARHNLEVLRLNFPGAPEPPGPGKSGGAPEKKPDPPSFPDTQQQASAPPPPPELSSKREQLLEQLRSLQMSEEQAQSILDAMKANELQYIFQLRKKQFAHPEQKTEEVEW